MFVQLYLKNLVVFSLPIVRGRGGGFTIFSVMRFVDGPLGQKIAFSLFINNECLKILEKCKTLLENRQ